MGSSTDNKSSFEHELRDMNAEKNTEAGYQPINPLQPSVTQESPPDALQQAVRRHFRINGVLQILNPWRPQREGPKIALHKGRSFAIVYFASVLVPLVGAIFLIVINARTTPLGYVSPSTVSALQFVAKFLDIMMQVTLTTLALHLVRKRLLGPNPLPFGAVLAPYRVADVSYLWSLDLWGSITSPSLNGPYKIFFCVTIPLIILLAAVTGPSSAILVIPRRIKYVSNEKLFLFNQSSSMYPSTMRLDGDGKLPAESEFAILANGVLAYAAAGGYGHTSTSTPIQDASGTRLLSFVVEDNGIWATMPTRLTGSFITTTTFERSTDFAETIAMQPWISSDCNYYLVANEEQMKTSFVDFGPNKLPLNSLISLSSLDPRTAPVDNTTTISSLFPQDIVCPDDDKSHAFNFTTLVHENPSGQNYSALAVGAFTSLDCPSVMNSSYASVWACTMNAAWSEYQVNSTATAQVADSYPIRKKDQANITVEFTPDFVMRMISLYMQGINNTNIDIYLEPLLTIAMANSLPFINSFREQGSLFFNDSSNPAPSDYFTQQQIDAARLWIDTNRLLWRYRSIEIFGLNNWTDPSSLVQMDLQTYRSEYGYDSTSIPVRFALVVFGLYVVVTAAYIIHTFVTGETGTSWDSVADLVMLAMNSRKPPAETGSTSVGVDSILTFREPVNVRVNEMGTAELVFDRDVTTDEANLTRVRRNIAY